MLHGAGLKSCSSTLSCLSLGEISLALWKLLTGCAVRYMVLPRLLFPLSLLVFASHPSLSPL